VLPELLVNRQYDVRKASLLFRRAIKSGCKADQSEGSSKPEISPLLTWMELGRFK
jgi:hypothetical protein